MGLMKVYSGSEVLALALQERLEEAGVETSLPEYTFINPITSYFYYFLF